MQDFFGVNWSGSEPGAEKFSNLRALLPGGGRPRKNHADE
jgi:hypothetical protein